MLYTEDVFTHASIKQASSYRATIEAEHRACIEPASSLHRACIEPQHRASIELSASSIEAGAQIKSCCGILYPIPDGQLLFWLLRSRKGKDVHACASIGNWSSLMCQTSPGCFPTCLFVCLESWMVRVRSVTWIKRGIPIPTSRQQPCMDRELILLVVPLQYICIEHR